MPRPDEESAISAPSLPVRPPETVSMLARDGVRLDADVYRPEADGTWPVLLMRVATGRRMAQGTHYAHPRWYAGHGYMVVVQDVRGTGTSGGRFRPFQSERDDGADAVAWASSLPAGNGVVGMMGSGYAGLAQLLALAADPPALRSVAPAFSGWDVFSDWAFEGGALRLAFAMGFALRTAAEAARRAEDGTAHRALMDAAASLPLADEIPCRPKVLRDYARYSHYDDWLTSPVAGAFWDALSPRAALEAGAGARAAVLQIAGWYDPRLDGTLAAHRCLSARTGAELLVGPWSGSGWNPARDGVDADSQPDMDRIHLDWFARTLTGSDGPAPPPVRLYDVLERRWRAFPEWPQPEPTVLHLASGGRAAVRPGDGRLAVGAAAAALDAVVHDPWNPVPAAGGHGTVHARPHDRTRLDGRPDVACYQTATLDAPVTLAGTVDLELWVEADAPSFDVAAALSAVTPDGCVHALTQGYARVEPGAATRPLTVGLRAVCATLAAGSALRLSLAGGCFPAHPVNPGTGAEPGETRHIDAQPITLLIHSGGRTPSRLRLPAGAA